MVLQVVTHRDVASVQKIGGEWQDLHDSSEDVNPFSGPDWALTWLEHFATDDREPFVLEVRDGERLVGVAPLYRQSILKGAAQVIRPIGTGAPWIGPYEVPSIAVRPCEGRNIARAMVVSLCEQVEAWDWTRLSLGSAATWFEPEWLPSWSYTVLVREIMAAVILDLSGEGDIYAGRRNLKESFRRARNRLTRDFGASGWSTRRIVGEHEISDAFERLAQLHLRRANFRRGRPIHRDVLEEPAVAAYVRNVVEMMARRGRASIYELLIGDEVGASVLVLHTETASYSSMSGIREDMWPYSAVTYLQSQAVLDAQLLKHRQFNLSSNPNQAKLRWSDKIDMNIEYGIVGPSRRSRALYLGAEAVRSFSSFRQARQTHRMAGGETPAGSPR